MKNGKIKVDLDMDAIARLASDGIRDMVDSGDLSYECPSCGEAVTLQMPETTCPHCGYRFRVELGEVEL